MTIEEQRDGTASHNEGPVGRIAALKAVLQSENIAACIVPSSDAHVSEYPPERWAARAWLSGFTGSVGTLVVTQSAAALWVDSRYWEQAGHQLQNTGIKVMRQGQEGVPSLSEWLIGGLSRGDCVVADGNVLAWSEAQTLRGKLQAGGLELRTDLDLVDRLWKERPPLPAAPVHAQAVALAGEGSQTKLQRLRAIMQQKQVTYCFLSALDDIAWLFNLRGSDVPFNPVFVAHALIDVQGAVLFMDGSRLASEARAQLKQDGVRIAPYGQVTGELAGLPEGGKILIDPDRTVVAMAEAVSGSVIVVQGISPVMLMKARKNETELSHVRVAMEHDGAALCRFMAWFDKACRTGNETEFSVGERLREERARHADFRGESFATIAGFRANGALPHYRAMQGEALRIAGDGMLLLDSGGQYAGATTDITRMLPVGQPDPEHKRDCAHVLRGLIALSRAAFPAGIGAPLLDVLARAPMWEEGINYGHGTGHGVGCALHVHEPPQRISYLAQPNSANVSVNVIDAGMITSVEPGIYRAGKWGVRIENLILACPAQNTGFGQFLRFETLTLCPVDLRCIDVTMMQPDEIAWLDAYHAEVRRRLAPWLEGDGLAWMLTHTEPVAHQTP